MIKQTGKPLRVKDKYITNASKGYFFRAAKITANRGGNRTGGGELKNTFCINTNTLYEMVFRHKSKLYLSCFSCSFYALRYISFIKMEKESKLFLKQTENRENNLK